MPLWRTCYEPDLRCAAFVFVWWAAADTDVARAPPASNCMPHSLICSHLVSGAPPPVRPIVRDAKYLTSVVAACAGSICTGTQYLQNNVCMAAACNSTGYTLNTVSGFHYCVRS